MIEDDSHLKLLPPSILEIYNLFEHIDTLSMRIKQQPYTVTPPHYLAQILGFWVISRVKMMYFFMVEADIHLKLFPTSILDIYKVFEHIDMLSMGIQWQPYTVTPTVYLHYLAQMYEYWLGHMWSQNDVIASSLRLTATSNCDPLPNQTYTKCLSTLICCPLGYISSLTQFHPHTIWLKFQGSGSFVESK